MEQADLVIIGAGIHGLTTASTYHHIHPEAEILIVDAAPSIGGPWASHRIFPGLKTNNQLGMYEHPDFPMDEQRFGLKKGEHIPAEKVLEYLQALTEHFGIQQFIRLKTWVDLIQKDGDEWKLHCTSSSSKFLISTPKLVIATGNTNEPSMPKYPTTSTFQPSVIHSKDFPAQYSSIVQPNKHTLVIGAAKSAWDVAYACATQPDAKVTLLIRPSGSGPAYIAPSHVTPFSLWLEKLVFTRFFGFMSPCPWATTTGPEGWMRSFLHNTRLGRNIIAGFFKVLGDDVVALNKLNEHPGTKKLVPWRGAFEAGSQLGIHNYTTSFFELVKEGRINVVIDEVKSFGEGTEVLLESGAKLNVHAVACATGWKAGSTLRFEPASLYKDLGLPSTQPTSPSEATLIQETESSLYASYPFLALRDSSRINHPSPSLRHTQSPNYTQQPYRLHRFIVPPAFLASRSIAFSGACYSLGQFPLAYVQALWITAYLDGTLSLPSASPEEIRKKVYRDTQYMALRNVMGYGRVQPDLVFDTLPLFDVLLGDLGVEGKRKGWGEWVRGYGPRDWRGVVGEWEGRRKEGGGGGGGEGEAKKVV